MMPFLSTMYENIALPIKGFRLRYLPILIVYFCYGFTAITSIGQTFWLKEATNLSAIEMIQISFWTTLPFTCKLLFGQCIETINIAGNRRRSYLVLGAILACIGNLILIGAVNHWQWMKWLGSLYYQLVYASVITWTGLMIQDLIADTLCAELVHQDATPEARHLEVGTIQVLGRMSLMFASLVSVGLGGYLTTHHVFTQVVWTALIAPIVSLLAAILLPNLNLTKGHLDWSIFSSGIAIIAVSIFAEYCHIPYAQEIILLFNLLVIFWLFTRFLGNYDKTRLRHLILGSIIIWVFRITPSLAPVSEWWQIDVLEFDPSFFAILSQIGSILAFLGTWCFSSYLIKKDIGWVVIALSIIHAVFFLPYLGMAFGLHHWTETHLGFGARSIAFFNTVLNSPFEAVSMAPILAFFTFYAPKENKAVWFALAASLLNIAISASALLGKMLLHLFAMERGKYEYIGTLYTTELLFILVIPVTVVILCARYRRQSVEAVDFGSKTS